MAERQGILDALSDYYQGFASIPGSVMDYVGSTDSATMAEDASQYVSDSASALAKQFKEDPVNMLLDMAPIVGEVRAFMDAEDLREAADQAEAQGNLEQAAKLRQEASVTMTGAIPLLGMGARAGKKIGTAGMGLYGSDVSQLGKIGGERAKQRVLAPEDPSMIGQRVSTATPTAKVAEEVGFHQTDQYAINGDMMMYNPDALKHNMELMSKYPALSTTARKAEGRFGDFKTTIIDNLDYYIKQSPTEFIERSTNWYKGANALANDMSRAYNLPVEATAGVLARLSPGMDWFQNVEQADRLVEIFTTKKNTPMPKGAGKFEGKTLDQMDTSAKKAEWIRAYDEHTNDRYYYEITPEGAIGDLVTTKEGKPSSFMWQSNKNLELAVDMLENPNVENVSKKLGLGGHKIRNFYNNIVDPFNPTDVTIDTHAVSAALMSPYSQKGIPVGHAFGGGAIPGVVAGSSKSGMASGTYGLYADAYREAANRNNLRAMEVQSPTWEIIRETFPTSGAGKSRLLDQIAPVQEAVRKGQMTPEAGRNAIIDIATSGQGLQFPSWMK